MYYKRNDNCNWKCTSCDEIYRTINILYDLLNNNE